MEKEYTLWHVANAYKWVEGTYNSYEAAYEAAKKLDEKYNDEANYWEEKRSFLHSRRRTAPYPVEKTTIKQSLFKIPHLGQDMAR